MGEDRRTGRGKGGVAIGMIKMPVRIDYPLRHSPEHAGDSVFNLRNAGTMPRVNDRSSRRSRNRRQIAPGARKDENTGPDLRRAAWTRRLSGTERPGRPGESCAWRRHRCRSRRSFPV